MSDQSKITDAGWDGIATTQDAAIVTIPWEMKWQGLGGRNGSANKDFFYSTPQYYAGQSPSGCIPIDPLVTPGTSDQTTNGVTWKGGNVGSDNADDSSIPSKQWHFEQHDKGVGNKGMHWHHKTNVNGEKIWRWFDFGAQGGAKHGDDVRNDSCSSWMPTITALWFGFNAHDTAETRGCYCRIENAALRYRDPYGKIAILRVTEPIGDTLTWRQGIRGSKKRVFGYQLETSIRESVCRYDYRLLGARIAFSMERASSGTTKDTLQCGVTAMRFTTHDSLMAREYPSGNGVKPTDRLIISRDGRSPYQDVIDGKFQVETYPRT